MAQAATESRIDHLAKHRRVPDGHLQDRRSVYWVERQPLRPPTVMAMTPRLEILSKSRNLVSTFKFNRDREFHINQEPFYREIKPTKGDGIPAASARVQALSAHKNTHNEYQYDRLLPMIAKPTAEATPRLQELARSKTELWDKKGGWPNEQMFYTSLPQPVSAAAMKASATPRVESLAEHKNVSAGFRPERPIRWDIDSKTLTANASLRVCQLARPRSRNRVVEEEFDPYIVSKAARHAQITPRVEELALPIPRKQRTKKAV